MKILFLTPRLAFGRNGLADYSLLLAGELGRLGHEPALFGWRMEAGDGADGAAGSIPILGADPAQTPWRRWASALSDFQPDWVSLQFVSFGYQPRGLPFGFARGLPATVRGCKTHLMLHEIWSGLRVDKRWRESLLGEVQRRLILAMVRRLSPAVVHTSIEYYRRLLLRSRVDAGLLPLFGNVPVTSGNAGPWLAPLLPKPRAGEESPLLICSFGSIHNPSVWLDIVACVNGALGRLGRRATVVFVGAGERGGILEKLGQFDRVDGLDLGMRSAGEVDELLNSCHFGIATTPVDALGKSGSAVAMAEHGLPILVRGRFHLCDEPLPAPEPMTVVDLDQVEFDPRLPKSPRRPLLGMVAKAMLADLDRAAPKP